MRPDITCVVGGVQGLGLVEWDSEEKLSVLVCRLIRQQKNHFVCLEMPNNPPFNELREGVVDKRVAVPVFQTVLSDRRTVRCLIWPFHNAAGVKCGTSGRRSGRTTLRATFLGPTVASCVLGLGTPLWSRGVRGLSVCQSNVLGWNLAPQEQFAQQCEL